jgi:hypothetical protein
MCSKIVFLFPITGTEQFKMLHRHPKSQQFLLLLKFFMRCVVLLSMDIITDISTAVDFMSRGHFYLGICTVVPIFAPFALRILRSLVNLCQCFKLTKHTGSSVLRRYRPKINRARLSFCVRELKQLIWHFPMLQPLRLAFHHNSIFEIKSLC